MKKIGQILMLLAVVFLAVFFLSVSKKEPSHDRDWEVGQEELPRISIVGDDIEIFNFRDFNWQEDGSVDKKYINVKYRFSEIEKVDVIISHFSDFEGLAHIFLSFGFTDGRYVVVSMETRREDDEEFSAIKGLFREFEIIYVVGSEQDILGLRTNVRGERVYVYPTIADAEKSKELFLKITKDVNTSYERPKFYNTLSNNCTNVITRRVEEMSDLKFPFSYKTLLPGYFDEVLYDMEIIPSQGSFKETKKCHFVNNEKVDYRDDDFSFQLRNFCYN